MAGEKDESFLEEIGLGQLQMMQTKGSICAEKFDIVLDSLKITNTTLNAATKSFISTQLTTWVYFLSPEQKQTILEKNFPTIFNLVETLAVSTDEEAITSDGAYVGNVFIGLNLITLVSNHGSMDFTGNLVRQYSQQAYTVLETILTIAETNPKIQFTVKSFGQSNESANDYRTQICQKLVRFVPNQGTVELTNGMKVIALLLVPKNRFPTLLINDTKSTLSVLTMVAKSSIAHSGRALLEIVKSGGNDQLLTSYMTMPELYTNCPEAVHENLEIFLRQPYMQYAYLFSNIAAKAPEVIIPHLQFFIDQLTNTPMVGTLTLMVLENIAKYDHAILYPKTKLIVEKSKSITSGTVILAKVLAQIGLANEAADEILIVLVDLLESSASDAFAAPGILHAISNITTHLSSPQVLAKQLPRIAKFKSVSEVVFTSIDDYAAGRSLEILTVRVDVIEAKIVQMNAKISETCTNMADVIAYVDANMADMKDFLADVVKKLPNPKRLEVVGTLRKTLILHFECCHTGYEFPIVSHEWSKWLKMGFSLAKAGKAVIDIGMGNPLGLLSTGITAVQEIYEAYQTNDDDEFNTYITQPFLTSAEQDQLIGKLRDQGFFDVFAYDAQKAGWYLLHPEKDGTPPGGEAGSVTKVRSKKGFGGIAEAAVEIGTSVAMSYINNDGTIDQMDIADTVLSGDNAVTFKSDKKNDIEQGNDDTMNPMVPRSSSKSTTGAKTEAKEIELETKSSTMKSPPTNYTSGGRAAAMKEKMDVRTLASAEATVQEASRTAEYYSKVDAQEKRIQQLENKLNELQSTVETLKNRNSRACIIM